MNEKTEAKKIVTAKKRSCKTKKIATAEERSYRTKKIAILGLITAMAYVAVLFVRVPIIPAVPFLDLEFKSAIILIGAYIFGPLSGLCISVCVCIVEMFTISDTGVIGCIMNILATACFVCPAALIYKKRRKISGALIGLAAGTAAMTAAMILWNYIVTPMYMNVPREAVAQLLIPAFIPFNLLKSAINGSIALLIYKLVVTALRKQNLIPESNSPGNSSKGVLIGTAAAGLLVLLTCALIIMAYNSVI